MVNIWVYGKSNRRTGRYGSGRSDRVGCIRIASHCSGCDILDWGRAVVVGSQFDVLIVGGRFAVKDEVREGVMSGCQRGAEKKNGASELHRVGNCMPNVLLCTKNTG